MICWAIYSRGELNPYTIRPTKKKCIEDYTAVWAYIKLIKGETCCKVEVKKWESKEGSCVWGGVEAKLSKIMSEKLNKKS